MRLRKAAAARQQPTETSARAAGHDGAGSPVEGVDAAGDALDTSEAAAAGVTGMTGWPGWR
jgi:hypothetical protein